MGADPHRYRHRRASTRASTAHPQPPVAAARAWRPGVSSARRSCGITRTGAGPQAARRWSPRLANRRRATGSDCGRAPVEAAMLSPRLNNFLEERNAPYATLSHIRSLTAHETAEAAHVDHERFAKPVIFRVDGQLAMVVMPAAYRADLLRLSRALGGATVELAEESEIRDAFPDCELGAMPPFGHLYGMPV
ncbi:MAG: YbaK/EbsC family protein, partial [Lysobacteraceae bacterium]